MVGDLEDILIIGCYAEGNDGPGFSFVGGPYTTSGHISVTFQDCVSDGDLINFQVEAARHDIDGSVTFRNCKGFNAETNGFEAKQSGMFCEVDGMWIFNANQSGQVDNQFGSSYAIYSSNNTDGSTYGNVRIRNAYAYGTATLKTLTQLISGEATSVIENVDAEIHTNAAALKRAAYSLSSSQVSGKNRVVFTDETEIATTSSLSTSTMPAYLSDLITNTGASGALALVLDDPLTRLKGVRVRARVKAAQPIQLSAEAGWTIGGGASLRSRTVGSEVTVESDGVSKWRIVEAGEGWHPDPIAFGAADTTPSVSGGRVFETGGAVTITALDDGVEGQEITIYIKHAVTFDCTATTLTGNGGVDITAASGDLVIARFDGVNWRLQHIDCTA